MPGLLLGNTVRGKAWRAIVGYIIFFLTFGIVGSNKIIGIEPIVFGWIPAWLFVTYVLSVVFLIYTFWILGQFDEYIVGEETPSMLRGTRPETPPTISEKESE